MSQQTETTTAPSANLQEALLIATSCLGPNPQSA